MIHKRSRLEIYLDILKTIKKGTRKTTRIMYKTNLSWQPLMRILHSFVAEGLVIFQIEGKHHLYELTEKGETVLENLSKAVEWERRHHKYA